MSVVHKLIIFISFLSINSNLCAQSLSEQIDLLLPNQYWPLQNSFDSKADNGQVATFIAEEKSGPTLTPQSDFYQTDYFPVTPLHQSIVPGSNGLWLGETTGDLAGAKRFLSLTANEVELQEPLTYLGMDAKDDWTLHIVVSPDPDPENARPAEPLFYVGNHFSNVKITVDANDQGAIIQVIRTGQNDSDPIQLSIAKNSSVRQWYQIILRYTDNPDGSPTKGLLLSVDNEAVVWRQSNRWLELGQPTTAYLGKEEGISTEYFHGAIQHLALWQRSLSIVEIDSLKSALIVVPAQQAPLVVDTNQAPQFYMWTVPTREVTPTNRDGLNWNDSFWDIPGVYPIIRHKTDSPSNISQYPNSNILIPENQTETELLAYQSYEWIKYIDDKLSLYTNKSLTDGIGYTLLWNDWGAPVHAGESGWYGDRGAVRALMQNWRDVPGFWRNNPHSTTPDNTEKNEINVPFYREGMSQNAFRSKAIFSRLNFLLTQDNLPLPNRLHFDSEVKTNLNHIIGNHFCSSDSSSGNGWLCAIRNADLRKEDSNYWGVQQYWGRLNNSLPDVSQPWNACIDIYDTSYLHEVSGIEYLGIETPRTLERLLNAYDSTKNKWGYENECFRNEFFRFTKVQYDYALGQSLKRPAMEALNPDIRMSEYGMWTAGDKINSAQHITGRFGPLLGRNDLSYLDFSAPNLYPMNFDSIDYYNDESLQNWAYRLNLSYSLFPSPYENYSTATASDVEEALDNLFVEVHKQNLNIAVKAGNQCEPLPQSPWFSYPSREVVLFNSMKQLYANLPVYTVKWQEVARLAAFAYRRGVREFLMFGEDQLINGANPNLTASTLNGIKDIVDRVNFVAANPMDFTSSNALSRSDPSFGIPDGVLDISDYQYFFDRLNEGDLEADIANSDISCAYPDGELTVADIEAVDNYFGTILQ